MSLVRVILALLLVWLIASVAFQSPPMAAEAQPVPETVDHAESAFYPAIVSLYLKDLEIAIRIAAICLGAIWAYFKFVKGRVFHSRLEPSVSGRVSMSENVTYLVAENKLKNVGLSKVDVIQKGSGLRVLACDLDGPTDVISATWIHLATFPVFEGHGWIEPGEPISEERLILVPKDTYRIFRLELKVSSEKITWSSMSIVYSEGAGTETAEAGHGARSVGSDSNYDNRGGEESTTTEGRDVSAKNAKKGTT